MAEENNVFGQFGTRSAKFDELLKKYQTIDEGDTVASPKPIVPQPESVEEPQEEIVPEPAEEPQEEVIPEPAEEPQEEIIPEPAEEPQEEVIPEPAEEPQEEEIPEPAEEPQEEEIPEPAEEPQEEEISEPEEPGFSYDIDIFSANGVSSTADIDSFDDSWIDSALDDSLFYRPVPMPETEPEYKYEEDAEDEPAPEETESVPVTEYEQEYYTDDPVQYDPEVFVDPIQPEPEKDVMAGGYIAPSDFGNFEFDPESGMDFDVDEDENEPEPEVEHKAIKSKKKITREKKDSGKNEMSSVTGFSKNYKASEGKGSKKDGFFVRNFIPKSSDTGLEKARKIIMIVCVLTFVFAAVYLFSDFVIQPFITANRLEKLESMVGKSNEVADAQELAEKYPDVEFPDGMLGKYAELYAKNSDLAGWINIEALDISLPVVQGEDNKEYLKVDFDGNRNKYGSVFANSENDMKNLNYNTVLFGHHMLDSKMFGNLTLYKDVENYKKAPVIEFNTIYGDYKWKIFAVFITNGTAEGDDGYIFDYTFTDLSSPEAVERFLGEIDQRAIYKPEVDISVSDKILTLSTCSYEFDEARLVVMARMVRPGESEEVSGVVRVNDNPRYPAAYYEEKGLTNPYESAYKWQPT
ncbi:MAG: class B sortase [Clostridia bacterium]|nr:class B sortase [Clostridia bacterium]